MSREMKESGIQWIGDMPAEWICNRVKLHLHVNHGSDPHTEGNIPVYGSGTESFKTCGEYKIGPAILLGRKGSIENPRYVEEKFWNVDTAFDAEVYSDDMLPKFFYYLACVFDYKSYISQTTLPSMTQGDYKNMNIPVPPLPEQQAISAFLDLKCSAIDDSITKHKAIIDKLEEYRKALITQTVTKGLELNVEMKDSGVKWIGKIPTSWDTIALKRLASIQTGNTPTKKEGNHNYSDDNGIPWIKAENLDYLEPVHYTSEYLTDEGIKLGRLFKAYTIFVCCIASVGKVGFSDIPCSCNQQINAIHFDKNKIFWKYGFYVLKASSEEHIFKANTSVQMILNSTQEGYIKLPVPATIDEQKAIANYLDKVCIDVNKMVDKHNAIIDKLKEYKQSLIYNAVTGKIDCRKEA